MIPAGARQLAVQVHHAVAVVGAGELELEPAAPLVEVDEPVGRGERDERDQPETKRELARGAAPGHVGGCAGQREHATSEDVYQPGRSQPRDDRQGGEFRPERESERDSRSHEQPARRRRGVLPQQVAREQCEQSQARCRWTAHTRAASRFGSHAPRRHAAPTPASRESHSRNAHQPASSTTQHPSARFTRRAGSSRSRGRLARVERAGRCRRASGRRRWQWRLRAGTATDRRLDASGRGPEELQEGRVFAVEPEAAGGPVRVPGGEVNRFVEGRAVGREELLAARPEPCDECDDRSARRAR